ncbi:hypothetical protein NCG97_18640 [Streptomyces lydicamycinicus]|uniref:Uncharacterized protein n=1 Tax=Streptomyces lydicamycinicus TaxID=1546107 RepID=A0A0P4R2Q6_9ACTN|nr:hypothetical protein [Streptomyces lydicamycinicus]USA02222.1 hypothetical protein NCG97_18640 [Streptomyces lydicamycinicus]GAO07197.1 hypothetical protein TPA0598_02_04360 [Streptomyces lydicamycinicus]
MVCLASNVFQSSSHFRGSELPGIPPPAPEFFIDSSDSGNILQSGQISLPCDIVEQTPRQQHDTLLTTMDK